MSSYGSTATISFASVVCEGAGEQVMSQFNDTGVDASIHAMAIELAGGAQETTAERMAGELRACNLVMKGEFLDHFGDRHDVGIRKSWNEAFLLLAKEGIVFVWRKGRYERGDGSSAIAKTASGLRAGTRRIRNAMVYLDAAEVLGLDDKGQRVADGARMRSSYVAAAAAAVSRRRKLPGLT